MFASLSYFGVVAPVLTAIVSLFLATVGATLAATARSRGEDAAALVRSTLISSIPGAMLLLLMLYGAVSALL